jgi:hypothetical protein
MATHRAVLARRHFVKSLTLESTLEELMEESNGVVEWGEWFFNYAVIDTEGLCLIDGHFKGQHIFTKLSLPVIRVKYLEDEDIPW